MDLLNTISEKPESCFKAEVKRAIKQIELYNDNTYYNELESIKHEQRKIYLKKIFEKELQLGIIKDEIYEKYLSLKSPPKIYKYLITISFKENTTPDDTKLSIVKFKNKVNIKQIIALSHEQRGETIEEMGIGYHIHIYLETFKTWNKCECIRETYSCFKSHVSGDNYIDIRKITKDNGIDSYLSGDKKDPHKLQKTIIDKSFIQKFNIINITP